MGKLTRGLLAVSLIMTLGFFYSGEVQAQKKVRFAYPSSADMGDIPSLLAWEQLKKQGIEVVPTFFPKTELAVQAVVAGEADMGSAAGIAVVKAVESGMNVRIIAEQVRNEWQLVTPVSHQRDQTTGRQTRRLPRADHRDRSAGQMDGPTLQDHTQLDDHSRFRRPCRGAHARPTGCDTGRDRRRVEYSQRQARPVSRLDFLRQNISRS